MFPKTRRWRSESYLNFVRSNPCQKPGCASHAPSEAHHWHPTEKGMGRKPSDQWTLSLCRRCHRYYHDHGVLEGLTTHETWDVFVTAQWRLMGKWISNYCNERETDGNE